MKKQTSTFCWTVISTTLCVNTALGDLKHAVVDQYIKNHKTQKNHIRMLFLQQAKAANIDQFPASATCYRLTLPAAQDHVIYFSDQPQRLAGAIDNEEFTKVWIKNKIRPNVVLQGFKPGTHHKKQFAEAFEIRDIDYNKKANTFVYKACLLDKDHLPKHATLEQAALFIDDVHQWPP